MSQSIRQQLDTLYPSWLGAKISEKGDIITVRLDNQSHETHRFDTSSGRLVPVYFQGGNLVPLFNL